MITRIHIFIYLFTFNICSAQETNLILSLEDLNIPFLLTSEAIELGKKLIEDKKLNDTQKEDSILWNKFVVRAVDREDFVFPPFDTKKYIKEYSNKFFYWDTIPKSNTNFLFLENLHNLALEKNIHCYSFNGKKSYGQVELNALIKLSDTYIDIYGKTNYVYNTLDLNSIDKIVVIEEWVHSINNGIKNTVIGIGPILPMYDDSGNYEGSILMCWFIL